MVSPGGESLELDELREQHGLSVARRGEAGGGSVGMRVSSEGRRGQSRDSFTLNIVTKTLCPVWWTCNKGFREMGKLDMTSN